jgi:hypothetical protein
VIQDWIPSFLDEMNKLGAALTKDERRRQALQFGALGAVSGSMVGSVSNLIQKGRLSPEGVKSPRWLRGSMAAGMITGGATPVVRHGLERNMQSEANDRARRTRLRAERRALAGKP